MAFRPAILFILLLATNLSAQATSWADYEAAELGDICFIEESMSEKVTTWVPDFKFRVKAEYTGQNRAITKESISLLKGWIKNPATASKIVKMYKKEYLFTRAGQEYWMPVQSTVEPAFKKSLTVGETINLYIYRFGAIGKRWFLYVNDYTTGDKIYE